MIKKLLAIALVFVLAFTLAVPFFAEETIQPRAAYCGKCGTMNLLLVNEGPEITDVHYDPCIHGHEGVMDTFYLVYRNLYYSCGYCGFSTVVSQTIRSYVHCNA